MNLIEELRFLEETGLKAEMMNSNLELIFNRKDQLFHGYLHRHHRSDDSKTQSVTLSGRLPSNLCTECTFKTSDGRLGHAISIGRELQLIKKLTPFESMIDAANTARACDQVVELVKLTRQWQGADYHAWAQSQLAEVNRVRQEADAFMLEDPSARKKAHFGLLASDTEDLNYFFHEEEFEAIDAPYYETVGDAETLDCIIEDWSDLFLHRDLNSAERIDALIENHDKRYQKLEKVTLDQLPGFTRVTQNPGESLSAWMKRAYLEEVRSIFTRLDEALSARVEARMLEDAEEDTYLVSMSQSSVNAYSNRSLYVFLASGVKRTHWMFEAPKGVAEIFKGLGHLTAKSEGADPSRVLETYEVLIRDKYQPSLEDLLVAVGIESQ